MEGEVTVSIGKKNGVEKFYYDNGKLKSEIPFIYGLKNGVEKEYYENGKIKSETTYIYGVEQLHKNYDSAGIVINASQALTK